MSIAALFFIYLKISSVAAFLLFITVVNNYKKGTNKNYSRKPERQREKRQYIIYSELLNAN